MTKKITFTVFLSMLHLNKSQAQKCLVFVDDTLTLNK